MNCNINIVKLTGRVTKFPNINITNTKGTLVGNVSIALDASGDRTLFIDITAWKNKSDILLKLMVGDLIFVDGRLDLDYKDHKKIIVIADKITLMHSKWFDKLGRSNDDLEQMTTIEEIKKLSE